MNVRKVGDHGKPRYLVDIGKAEYGRRLRRFFPTRDAAEAFHRAHRDGVRRMGVSVRTDDADAFFGPLPDIAIVAGRARTPAPRSGPAVEPRSRTSA